MNLTCIVFIFIPLLSFALINFPDQGGHFHECPGYFKDGSAPTGFVHDDDLLNDDGEGTQAEICQQWGGNHHFATLYDIELRSPIYSAYRLTSYERPRL